jgi:hypothetical protein
MLQYAVTGSGERRAFFLVRKTECKPQRFSFTRIGGWIEGRGRDAYPGLLKPQAPEGIAMVSTWWLIVAILGGASAGMLAMALMQIAGEISDQPSAVPD